MPAKHVRMSFAAALLCVLGFAALAACSSAGDDAPAVSGAPECPDGSPLACIVVDVDTETPGVQATRSVRVDQRFSVDVLALNIPEAGPGLGGFQVTLLYDGRVLRAGTPQPAGEIAERLRLYAWDCTSPQPTNRLPEDHPFSDHDGATTDAYIACFNTKPKPDSEGPIGAQVVATIRFEGKADGASALTLYGAQATLQAEAAPLLVDCASREPAVQSAGCAGAEIVVKR